MRYAVVIEKSSRNYFAYVPDVPGCAATGKKVQETLGLLREALAMHFESMRGQGEPIPDPQTLVDYIDVGVAVSINPESTAIAPRTFRGKQRGTKVG